MSRPDPQPPRLREAIRHGNWGDLGRRVLSGAVLTVLGVVLLVSSGLWLRFGVSFVVGLMMWELARLTGWRHPEFHSPRHPVLIGVLSGLVMLPRTRPISLFSREHLSQITKASIWRFSVNLRSHPPTHRHIHKFSLTG